MKGLAKILWNRDASRLLRHSLGTMTIWEIFWILSSEKPDRGHFGRVVDGGYSQEGAFDSGIRFR